MLMGAINLIDLTAFPFLIYGKNVEYNLELQDDSNFIQHVATCILGTLSASNT